jgi:hypothetical protein
MRNCSIPIVQPIEHGGKKVKSVTKMAGLHLQVASFVHEKLALAVQTE